MAIITNNEFFKKFLIITQKINILISFNIFVVISSHLDTN